MQGKEVKKQWAVKQTDYSETLVAATMEKYRISRATAELICDRSGNTPDGVHNYINRDICEQRDPRLLKDMDKAVERILVSIKNKDDVIAIYGDYDVDGVTSVSMLYLYLTSLGLKVGYYIPSRNDEGYGVNRAAIKKLKARGVTMIITVDTGITAIDEVEYARSLGIDVIVTDHHECRAEIPDAIAVINPHRADCDYPFKELAGVGVAFKLISAIELARCPETGKAEFEALRSLLLEYGDLVAIGTVADVMPIIDENRTLVSMGLKIIEVRPRLGIAALIEASSNKTTYSQQKRDITTTFIGFTLAPRINAAGRMGNAAVAVELLLAENEENAKIIAEELCEMNRLRQSEENKIVDAALEKIEEEWSLHIKNGGVIVLADDDWQQGVIGIVASRITERYGMPSILITFQGSVPLGCDESPVDLGKGSGRSVSGFNLVAALSECSELLEKYGGHELAAGLALRRGNLECFRKRINEYARPILDKIERVQILEADRVLEACEVNLDFAKEIALLVEPCGPQNPTPSFIMTDVVITSVRGIGAGKHIKFTFEKQGSRFTGLYFGVAESQNTYKFGDLVDLMFTIGINHFNGNTEVQLILTDMRYADSVYTARIEERNKLFSILDGAAFSASENILPSRRDFVAMYRLLDNYIKEQRFSVSDTTAIKLFSELLQPEDVPSFVKYRLILEIFNELDIFKVEYIPLVSDKNGDRWQLPEDICVISRGSATKVELDNSRLLGRLRKQITD
ncbi:MAG: single-stranded-DNA-specific exonuclease RecJ [Eubacteriales bacterium]